MAAAILAAAVEILRGQPMPAELTRDSAGQPGRIGAMDPAEERRLAVDLFNETWRLMELEDRTADEDDRMLHMAHASRFHWGEVGTSVNRSRGEWQISRVYALLRRAEPALHHARRGLAICEANGTKDWDLAYAYESLARACAVAGDSGATRSWLERARAAAGDIADEEDRELLFSDLATIPGAARQ
jgi:hypothetical protein